MTALNTDPVFESEAQEVFTPGCRVFTVDDTTNLGKGADGTYVGKYGGVAVVDWDTPSGEPFRSTAPFTAIRNLYR